MKTRFDKIYVISLIDNKERRKFIDYQFNQLGLDFEYIYGIDFYNFKNIQYPDVIMHMDEGFDNAKMYGCTMSHYRAILQAYEFGYNNVLIIEDDICFSKNKNDIEYILNNSPEDADFISYVARFTFQPERDQLIECIKNTNNMFINIPSTYFALCGTMMYSLMNRKTMKLYLDNQRSVFFGPDHVVGIYSNVEVNRYTPVNAICIDQYNRFYKDNKIKNMYADSYLICNNINDYEDYYEPFEYNISNINKKLV